MPPVPNTDARGGSAAGQADVAEIARRLMRWKQCVAPAGSLRARALRRVAGHLFPSNKAGTLRRAFASWPEPRARVTIWDCAGPLGHVLPCRSNILILKLDHIGDFVVALPALRLLRDAFPSACLTLVCQPWNAAFALTLGWFDRVVPFDGCALTPRAVTPVDAACRADFASLNLGDFALAIDLRYESDTRPLLMCVDSRYRAGFHSNGMDSATHLDLALPDCQDTSRNAGIIPLHAETRLVALAAAAAAMFGRRRPELARGLAQQKTKDGRRRPYAVIAPGTSAPIKRWPIERLGALAGKLIEHLGVDVVIAGADNDRADADTLAAQLPGDRVTNLAGRIPLAELPDLLISACLFVGYDSGPAHLAASLGVPTVCIFSGVSDVIVWQPLGPAVTIVNGQTGCSPCKLTYAADCPNGVACVEVISVDSVFQACERYVADVVSTGSP